MTTGSCFGEGALLNQSKTRQATIRCETACYFGTLSQESFKMTVQIMQQNIINKKIDFIMNSLQICQEYRRMLQEHHYFWKP